jgi:hypothetical protein
VQRHCLYERDGLSGRSIVPRAARGVGPEHSQGIPRPRRRQEAQPHGEEYVAEWSTHGIGA